MNNEAEEKLTGNFQEQAQNVQGKGTYCRAWTLPDKLATLDSFSGAKGNSLKDGETHRGYYVEWV